MTLRTLLAELISCRSVTPDDAGCQTILAHFLSDLGFQCTQYDNGPVRNLYAQYGTQKPMLMFAGHTDVVPIGDASKWETDPFTLVERQGYFYGRGVADMKGSLAAMMIAAERFVTESSPLHGGLSFLITSAEEGDDYALGTPYVMSELQKKGIQPDFCIVGEPSSTQQVGDVIKVGRRGSLSATIHIQGKQGHVAYPQFADNPIHRVAPALAELVAIKWDQGNTHFPPTQLQLTEIQSGGYASNVIPGTLTLALNIRYSTEQRSEQLKQQVEACFQRHHLNAKIQWRLSGEPFLTEKGQLLDCCIKTIQEKTQQTPELSTSGGTSDGRFIAPYHVEVIELGPVNATIHQTNECVSTRDLETLSDLYFTICKHLIS